MAPALAPPPKDNPSAKTTRKKNPLDPNVLEVVFGNLLIKPWYPSFYPEELVGRTVERLYVCQWCFKYSRELLAFWGHVRVCGLRSRDGRSGNGRRSRSRSRSRGGSGKGEGEEEDEGGIPGEEIYRKDGVRLFEVDGEEYKLFSQNLSLFAKLFLDTKSVFYDVTTFLYYLLVVDVPTPCIPSPSRSSSSSSSIQTSPTSTPQIIGFFSKEKMSWDNNNLACILVFPPWQRQGWGQVLMGASYEMSKREGRLGGPEKPLSTLGRRAYTHYWSLTLARTILHTASKKSLTVLDLRDETFIVPEDIIATLQGMEVLADNKKRGVVINKAKVRAWAERNGVDVANPVDPGAFVREVEEMDGVEKMDE